MAGGEQAEAAALGADEVPLEKRGWQCGTRRKSSIALRFSHSVSHKFLVDTDCVYCAHHTVFPHIGCGELLLAPVPEAHRWVRCWGQDG